MSAGAGPAGVRAPGRARRRLLCCAFVGLYLVYAINYAYFFVDDEAIPFVYAQNLIEGHGLVYNPDDGPAEGYSDFLSVAIDAAILKIVQTLGGDKLLALVIAKLIALSCAAALVALTFFVISRRFAHAPLGVASGMTFLALSGPLGVWGWSGLETTLLALLLAILLATLLDGDAESGRFDALALAAAVLMLLCRIDGAVWVAALLAPFLVAAPRPRRRQLILRVVVPAIAIFVAYHTWRFWYFGDVLPMPVYAKVIYKLGPRNGLVSNDPPAPYVLAFVNVYRWIPVAAIAIGSGLLTRRAEPKMRPLSAGTLIASGYLWLVGDWMFGFRFFVPLLAPLSILVASAFAELSQHSRRAALAATLVWMTAVAALGYDFERRYEYEQQRQSWWRAPGVDPARMFAPYYDVYLHARPYVVPGAITAYNQAGFVPFMLGTRNIDDLGICTKFYAKLPTTDVVFTEVGRYSPLTAEPVRRASETYTLARAPRLLIEPRANLLAANTGLVPRTVLGGTYRLLLERPAAAVYVPSTPPGLAPESGPYLENLVHISHLRRAEENAEVIPPAQYKARLPYLFGKEGRVACQDRFTGDFSFADQDEDVYELFIGRARSSVPASLELTLTGIIGAAVYHETFAVQSREPRGVFVRLPEPVRASSLSIAIVPASPGGLSATLEDVRVQGQTGLLKQFLARYHVRLS